MSENWTSEHRINRRSLVKLAALLTIATGPLQKAAAALTGAPRVILGRPTKNSVAISVMADATINAYVEYGTSKSRYSAKTKSQTVKVDSPAIFDLTELKSNSLIYYRISYTQSGKSSVTNGKQYSFRTARSDGSTFSFTLHGDTHPERKGKMFNEDLYLVTLSNVLAQKPDFHIMMGDDFSIDPLIGKGQATAINVDKVYFTHRQWLETMANSVPLFLVNGNHEQAAAYLLDGSTTNPAVLAGKARLKYFPLPAPDSFYSGDKMTVDGVGQPRDYYSWEWGDALFIVLDPYWHSKNPVDNVAGETAPDDQQTGTKAGNKKNTGTAGGSGNGKTTNLWSIGIGDEQYLWLKDTLEKSKAKYKFVFAHHVMGTGRGAVEVSYDYEWGGRDPKGVTTFAKERPNWELPIHDLMVKNGVSIFFQGHDHIFVTQERDGLIYQSMPNPADDTFSYFNDAAYKSGTKAPNSGHVRVTVTPENAKVEYFLAARSKDTGRKNLALAHSYLVKPKTS